MIDFDQWWSMKINARALRLIDLMDVDAKFNATAGKQIRAGLL